MAAPAAIRPFSRLLQTSRLTGSPLTTTSRPAALCSSRLPASTALFSTTAPALKRRRYKTRDRSKQRGVSSLYGSGPREFLSVSNEPLPRPRDAAAVPPPATDPDHGLWGFFAADRGLLTTPEADAGHGRAWTVEELRRKSWEDLHALWYVCLRERNRLATATAARKKHKIGFGEVEANERDAEVRKTMKAIKHTLTERFYTWEDAVEVAKEDPEIDLSGRGSAFTPKEYLEDEAAGEGEKLVDGGQEGEQRTLAESEVDPSTLPSTKSTPSSEPRA